MIGLREYSDDGGLEVVDVILLECRRTSSRKNEHENGVRSVCQCRKSSHFLATRLQALD